MEERPRREGWAPPHQEARRPPAAAAAGRPAAAGGGGGCRIPRPALGGRPAAPRRCGGGGSGVTRRGARAARGGVGRPERERRRLPALRAPRPRPHGWRPRSMRGAGPPRACAPTGAPPSPRPSCTVEVTSRRRSAPAGLPPVREGSSAVSRCAGRVALRGRTEENALIEPQDHRLTRAGRARRSLRSFPTRAVIGSSLSYARIPPPKPDVLERCSAVPELRH